MNKPLSIQLLAWTAIGAVIVVAGIGLFMGGSPSRERARKLDEERVNRLTQVSYAIDNHLSWHQILPETLDPLQNEGVAPFTLTDPETKILFEYHPATSTYQLCATFGTASDDTQLSIPMQYPQKPPAPLRSDSGQARSFKHNIGRTCFDLIANPPSKSP